MTIWMEQTSAREVKWALMSIRELWQAFAYDPEDNMVKDQLIFGRGIGTSGEEAGTFNAVHGIPTQTVKE